MLIPRNLCKHQPISICRTSAQVSMMRTFLTPKTPQMPTPEHSPLPEIQPHPDETAPKEQLESFADQVDYLSDHPSEAEKTESESENSDTASATHTTAAPPRKRKKLDIPYCEQRRQGQIR